MTQTNMGVHAILNAVDMYVFVIILDFLVSSVHTIYSLSLDLLHAKMEKRS